jgi:Uma2 family endonuclease
MTQLHTPDVLPPNPPRILPLQNGDRLTRDEFERRYNAMPHLNKAQLIEGVVYMPSPVTHTHHGNPHFNFIGWLNGYTMYTPGVEGGDNGSLRLDLDNEPQPDAYLIIRPDHGGQVRIEEGYIVGAPEWVGEVSASSVSIDLHAKLNAYRQNGVREYVVWRVFDRTIDWFVLREGQFTPLPLGADGLYRSEVLPGLWLDPVALINGNMLALHQLIQQAVAMPEHAAFVARLLQAATQQS